jgi:predicted MFS family arabinose efflux permease
MGYNTPIWFQFVAAVVPPGERGAFFGWRSACGGVASLGAITLAGALLAWLPGRAGFAACFSLGALGFAWSWACMVRTRHDWSAVDRPREAAPSVLADGRALWRGNAAFRRYVGCRMVLAGASMATAFHVVAGQERFGLSAGESSLMAIALVYLPGLLGLWWGRAADRRGAKAVLVPATMLAGVAQLALAARPPLAAFVLCLLVIGCGNVVLAIGDSKWLLEVDEGRAGLTMSLFNLALLLPTAGLALAGGALADAIGIGPVFAIAGGCWLAGGALLALALPAPRAAETVPA